MEMVQECVHVCCLFPLFAMHHTFDQVIIHDLIYDDLIPIVMPSILKPLVTQFVAESASHYAGL